MGDFHPFAIGREDHRMVADHVTTAQGNKADFATLARTNLAITGAAGDPAQRHVTPPRRGLTQSERRAGGRIDLVAVMHFKDFDIPFGIENPRHFLHHLLQQVDAEAHIGGQHDRRPLGQPTDRRQLIGIQPSGTDDMGTAKFCGKAGMQHRRRGIGEIDHDIRRLEQRGGIFRHRNAQGLDPRQGTEILAHGRRTPPLGTADHHHAGRIDQQFEQHLPHATGATDDRNLDRPIALTSSRERLGGRRFGDRRRWT